MNRKLCLRAGALALVTLPMLVSGARAQQDTDWVVGKPHVYDVSDLMPGRFAPKFAVTVSETTGNLETPVVKEHPYGDAGGLVFRLPMPPGRYRAAFEIGADAYKNGDVFADVEVQGDKLTSFKSRVTPIDFPKDSFTTKSVDFVVPTTPVASVTIKPTWLGVPDAEAFRLKQITVTRLSGPIFVAGVMPDKVLYRPGEAGTIKVTVTNGSDTAASVTARLSEETLLTDHTDLGQQDLSVAAGETRDITMPFKADDRLFGRRYVVDLVQGGKVIDSGGDEAAVANNLWDVALGSIENGIVQGTGHATQAQIDAWTKNAREQYWNWFEKDFWAPDDWGNMMPTTDEWLSGQAVRYENKAMMKAFIAEAHSNGIRAITYGKGMSGGPSGVKLERRHPDWYVKDEMGVPVGRPVDVWDYDHWDDIAFHIANIKDFKSDWFYMVPDLRRLDVLDYGIDQLIGSTREFGWDGVRFDGQFTAGNDAMSTRNMQRMKQKILAAYPDYVFGYNIGGPNQFIAGIPHELREAAAGGGQWMNEGINEWADSSGGTYTSWRDYADKEAANGETVRRMGGSYHFIYSLPRLTAMQGFYKFALGTIAGAHPDYGGETYAAGCDNWGRYLTRWSTLVWNPNLHKLKANQMVVGLPADAPIMGGMADELVLSPTRRLVVTHLVETPPSDKIADTDPVALPALTGLKVHLQIPASEKVADMYLVQPDDLEPELLKVGADGSIDLPTLRPWSMLVADLHGHYTVPAVVPAFTAAPDPTEVAAAMGKIGKVSAADPLRPSENANTDPDRWVSQSEHTKWSARQTPRLDPDAEGGQAASYDKKMGGGVMAGYFSDLVPGLYQVTAHIKVLNPSPKTTILFHAYAETDHGGDRKTLQATDFANAYHDATLNVSYYGNEFIRVFVQGGVTNDDEVVMLDWTRLKLLERYNDTKLLADLAQKPETVTSAGPAAKVLELAGLHHELYNVDASLKKVTPDAQIDMVYNRDATAALDKLADYGTLVLIDYPLPSLPQRLAIRDWVRAGGHLVVFGGEYTLAQANWGQTFLEDILPATLLDAPDIEKLGTGAALGESETAALPGRPMVYFAEGVKPRPDARVLLWAAKRPMLLRRSEGKGWTVLCCATVLGEKTGAETPFWQWNGWTDALAGAIK